MHEHLHRYVNYPQYVKDHPHSFRLLLLHNPDMETGMLSRFEDIIEAIPGIEKLNWTLLPPAFTTMAICQIQILVAKEPGRLLINTSNQMSQSRRINIEAGTHYEEEIQPEDLELINQWCHRTLYT